MQVQPALTVPLGPPAAVGCPGAQRRGCPAGPGAPAGPGGSRGSVLSPVGAGLAPSSACCRRTAQANEPSYVAPAHSGSRWGGGGPSSRAYGDHQPRGSALEPAPSVGTHVSPMRDFKLPGSPVKDAERKQVESMLMIYFI